jgi:hypothetical protein
VAVDALLSTQIDVRSQSNFFAVLGIKHAAVILIQTGCVLRKLL